MTAWSLTFLKARGAVSSLLHICLQAEFEKIAEDVKKVKTRPTDQELLDLYGLYKQAVVGDINTGRLWPRCLFLSHRSWLCLITTAERPGLLDFKGKAKWDAWESRKGEINHFLSFLSACFCNRQFTGRRESFSSLWIPQVASINISWLWVKWFSCVVIVKCFFSFRKVPGWRHVRLHHPCKWNHQQIRRLRSAVNPVPINYSVSF